MGNREEYVYQGQELELFGHAKNWKAYFATQLRPYLRGDVLEVGAGLGTTTRVLNVGGVKSWTCLEPDPAMARELAEQIWNPPVVVPQVVTGTVTDISSASRCFDTILY